jgi:hypothetical protein
VAAVIRILIPLALLIGVLPAAASLYQPSEAILVPVKPDGVPDPFEFTDFSQRMVTLANTADPRPRADGKLNPDRQRTLDRVRSFGQNKKPTPEETAAHGADLLRLGDTDVDKALDLLAPHTRDRNPNYFILMTLAQVHLARGEAKLALSVYDDIFMLYELKMPATVKGWTPQQRNWIAKVDEDWLGRYLRLRLAESELKTPADQEEPLPLFPLPVKGTPHHPVRFVNDAGQYEPGHLAKPERDKLPPDAIAIVQQLLLWFPSDTRLYWLLAELYAADGKIDEADTIFYQCTWGRMYGNRRVLMEHKGAVLAAVEVRNEARRKEREEEEKKAYPIDLRMIFVYFGGVVLVGGLAFLRSRMKKKDGGSHDCCGAA